MFVWAERSQDSWGLTFNNTSGSTASEAKGELSAFEQQYRTSANAQSVPIWSISTVKSPVSA